MWSSINKIIIPASPEKANSLHLYGKRAFIAGGSYLVAEKPPGIEELIDINHLVSSDIYDNSDTISIGSGTDLQSMVKYFKEHPPAEISRCAQWSCPSKNIRNQRTIGGEIGRRRINSELYAILFALNAHLLITSYATELVSIRNWNGEGIIIDIEIKIEGITGIESQRFALIPSAPSFVFIAGVRRKDIADIVVSGKANDISLLTTDIDGFFDEAIAKFASKTVRKFHDDQYGSLKYKEHLIRTGLKRIREAI